MKKIVILLFFIFLITGCNVKVDLTINENLEVNEIISMGGTEELFKTYYQTTPSTVIDNLLKSWDGNKILSENNYLYRKSVSDNFKGIIAEKKYVSLDEYINTSIFYNQMYEKILYNTNGDLITFKLENLLPDAQQVIGRVNITSFALKIKVPFKVTDSNADRIDKETNTYIWHVAKYKGKENVILTFDKSMMYEGKSYNILLITFISVIIVFVILILLYYYPFYHSKNHTKK